MSLAYLFNSAWMAACFREAGAYERGAKNVRRTQAAVLQRIVERNRDTWFGDKHRFATIREPRDFQNAVPISTYDDYRPAVERIANGEQNVLTSDRVRMLEPTGGSTSGEKLIPFTTALQRSFHRAIRVWLWDLYSKRPAVRRGRAYWSITPLSQVGRQTKAGIPIGFENDAQYMSRWERFVLKRTTIVPPEAVRAPTIAAAQYATLFHLLRARDVSLISVWSPTFFTALLQTLDVNWERLVSDVAVGRITFDSGLSDSHAIRQHRPLAKRADELGRIFRNAPETSKCALEAWPSLALVSCWADGPSFAHANRLRQYLGDIEVQPKGLLATEAFVTVPLLDYGAGALAIRSHFFEFLPAGATAQANDFEPLLACELVAGRRYRVVVTTGGGLYRYQLHDEIEVVGFHRQAPLLRFVGKTDDVSDLVGEKLHAAHVQSVLERAFRELGVQATYSQLCAQSSAVPGYVLQIAAQGLDRTSLLRARLRETVESGLDANPGYKYARMAGQLRPLQLQFVDQRQADEITAGRVNERVAGGQRLGDIKPAVLQRGEIIA